jgi:DNA modification methylase
MSDIIKTFTIEGSAILDPFCGAGKTGVAAVSNNRIFCGIDIDEKNVKVTTGRINEIIGA